MTTALPRRLGVAVAVIAAGCTLGTAATAAAAPTTSSPTSSHTSRTASPTAPPAAPTGGRAAAQVVAAARAYGVPAALLAAYVDAQTGWRDHGARMSTSGGYGPAHLVDGSAVETGGRDGGGPGDTSGRAARERVDTLGRAARLTGASRQALESDPATNLRGAAALLADAQRRLGHPVGAGTDPGAWYAAVAATAPTAAAGTDLADATMASLRTGGPRATASGPLRLVATAVGAEAARQRAALQRAGGPTGTGSTSGTDGASTDCPRSLACEWLPAPYVRTGTAPGAYGNHDVADRPAGPRIDTIVIHDTEGYYDNDVRMVQDPAYLGWQYTVRSADGHVAQHMAAKDIGWQAGNWYMNMHSIGVEHEGFAARGGTWYTEAMYRSSARLVRHLAREYHVPLDRGHVIGHEQVPGTVPSTVAGMHWDPGPYWDWEHYFDLLGAPLDDGTRGARTRVRVGQAVRVLPDFATNVQPLTGCTATGVPCPAQGSNVVPVRQSPADDAPLVGDVGLRPGGSASTWGVADWGGRAVVGTDYVVGAVRGDWVGIWFAGRLGWVHDPHDAPTLRVLRRATVVRAGGSAAPTYGRAYPEAGAYPAGETVQPVVPLPYTIAPGQAYVVTDTHPQTDYYKAKTFDPATPGDHVDIVGRDRYLTVDLGHRIGYVRAADVTLDRSR